MKFTLATISAAIFLSGAALAAPTPAPAPAPAPADDKAPKETIPDQFEINVLDGGHMFKCNGGETVQINRDNYSINLKCPGFRSDGNDEYDLYLHNNNYEEDGARLFKHLEGGAGVKATCSGANEGTMTCKRH